MAGKKRSIRQPNSMYKVKVFCFSQQYETSKKTGPIARSGHRLVCNEKSMFAIGGYNPTVHTPNAYSDNLERRPVGHTVFHEIWRFDFDTKKWTKLESRNMSTELASCATAMSGNLMFLYGGTSFPFGNRINEEVSVCNLFTSEAVKEFNQIDIVGSTKPPKQYGQSMVVSGRYLYTVGGTDGYVYSMDVYRLDLRTRVWERLTRTDGEEPRPRYRHEVVVYENYLIVLGGGTSEEAFDFKKLPAFNLKSRRWETMDTLSDGSSVEYEVPRRRRCHVCVQDPSDAAIVFINGGINEDEAFGDTWRLNLRTLTWTALPEMSLPYGIFFHAAAVTPEGRMMVYGGVVKRYTDSADPARTSDVYGSWISVPKLKHACWEALVHYVNNGRIRVPDDVKKLGLPPHYEQRLKRCL